MLSSTLPAHDPLSLHRSMLLIREVEMRLSDLFRDREVPGFIHLSVGQEAVAAGVMSALERSDTVASNHRGHGHALAKGIDVGRFFLEIMGKAEGICQGRGGSMHIADMNVGMLGANGIVAAGIPIALGSALAHQVRKTANVAVVFFGDGALAEGVFSEALNLASLWRLPMLFVCENNGWSEFSPTKQQFVADVQDVARAYKVPAERVNGNDVEVVSDAARRAVSRIRSGEGPFLLECITHRQRGHFEGDPQKYRDDQEQASTDPIVLSERRLVSGGTDPALLQSTATDIRAAIDHAVDGARRGQAPDFDEARRDVYARPIVN